METTLIHVKMIRNFKVDSGFFHHKVVECHMKHLEQNVESALSERFHFLGQNLYSHSSY